MWGSEDDLSEISSMSKNTAPGRWPSANSFLASRVPPKCHEASTQRIDSGDAARASFSWKPQTLGDDSEGGDGGGMRAMSLRPTCSRNSANLGVAAAAGQATATARKASPPSGSLGTGAIDSLLPAASIMGLTPALPMRRRRLSQTSSLDQWPTRFGRRFYVKLEIMTPPPTIPTSETGARDQPMGGIHLHSSPSVCSSHGLDCTALGGARRSCTRDAGSAGARNRAAL